MYRCKSVSRNVRLLPAMLLLAVAVAATAANAAAPTLFASLGGETKLRSAVERFADIVIADDRINFSFAEADLSKFKDRLYEQLCEISGGPCRYGGRDMRSAHAKLNVTTAQFNALAEDLYIALDQVGVAYRQQNRLMALLAPMQRDIVKASPGSRLPTGAAPPDSK